MPTYTYRREDGTTFEVEQRITEDALKTCPSTGQPVKRIITSGAGLVFKGSGFYLTDYSRGGAASVADAGSGDSDKAEKKSTEPASDSGTSSESKGKDTPKAPSTGSSAGSSTD